MSILAAVVGLTILLIVLQDAFETIVLPRRVRRRLRLTRLFYSWSWEIWAAVARRLRPASRRENVLSYYGPLSLIMLLGVWAVGLLVGFAVLQWSLGSPMSTPEGRATFASDLYVSGTTLFTLGLGDVTPRTGLARLITVVETGTGIGFLALVIGYLPVIYQAFSRREASIALLDARAGSPPSAVELLRRAVADSPALVLFLRDWERWAAELLESHISYPVLSYYRSQHDSQSWLSALTVVLDLCALLIASCEGELARPARLTFAMARHAAVDLSQILGTPPRAPRVARLPPEALAELRALLGATGLTLRADAAADQKLAELRDSYEPYVGALAEYLFMPLPPWLPTAADDDWQTSVWEHARKQ